MVKDYIDTNDFTKEELHRAIASYQGRNRRFGGV